MTFISSSVVVYLKCFVNKIGILIIPLYLNNITWLVVEPPYRRKMTDYSRPAVVAYKRTHPFTWFAAPGLLAFNILGLFCSTEPLSLSSKYPNLIIHFVLGSQDMIETLKKDAAAVMWFMLRFTSRDTWFIQLTVNWCIFHFVHFVL